MTVRWIACNPDLGSMLWAAYRPHIGDAVGVGAGCTDDDFVMTEVWTRGTKAAPLLRVESWYDVGDYEDGSSIHRKRTLRGHTYLLPTVEISNDDD